MEEGKEKKTEDNIRNSGIAGMSSEVVQRYGAAAKEHYVAYSGRDNEADKTLVKGLKDISREKVNPEYKYQNIRQQAGFSAEVKEVANSNAENIIAGSRKRKIRTDDLGRVNDQLYDHVELDANGDIIDGSGAQMKFIGADSKDPSGEGAPLRTLRKLQSDKFRKYLDNDSKIEVPSDYYDKIIQEADEQLKKLNTKLEQAAHAGNKEQTRQLKEQIETLKKIKRNLRKSTVSSKEALFARTHPGLSTAKSVMEISHRAGKETASTAAVFGGCVSVIRNVVAVVKGEEEPGEAVAAVAKETASAAAIGYGTGFAGSAIKGAMQNSSSEGVRILSKTNLAGSIVSVSVSAAKSIKKYMAGEIDGVMCFEELGEQGTGMLSSALFTAVGQAVIPNAVIGGLLGGVLGYAIASASYGILLDALKEEQAARERRLMIEKACEEHIALIREYRAEIEEAIQTYLQSAAQVFHDAFSELKASLEIGDVDGFISGANTVTRALGKEVSFSSFDEFDSLMNRSEAFKL